MKRGLMAVLALTLALGGCGGSESGGASGAASTQAASAPAPGPSGAAPGASPGEGNAEAPTPPAQSKATKAFNDCMHRQGVRLPSPNPTYTPAKKDLEKIKAALRTCVRSMSASPRAEPG